ncbi:MAG: hypothetical protein PVF58_11185 [Candidatus Methanofastidiosia archaeon]
MNHIKVLIVSISLLPAGTYSIDAKYLHGVNYLSIWLNTSRDL